MNPNTLNAEEIRALEARHYNATVAGVRDCAPRLRILRVRPDAGPVAWTPGQYLGLGLGMWAPRADGARVEEIPAGQERDVVVRHYSFSHPILAPDGRRLARQEELGFHEFYIAMPVYPETDRAPRFTPRLFALGEGDRLFVEGEAAGTYTAAPVSPEDDVVFFATGTGEAPHNALIWHLLSRGHRGRVASAVCTQLREQQGYREVHLALEGIRPGYRYLPLTTREPENEGRRIHLQQYVDSGEFERDLGWTLDPRRTHVFLCGNPAMIGIPRKRPGSRSYPRPTGMIEVLERRGFNGDERTGKDLNIHYERFW